MSAARYRQDLSRGLYGKYEIALRFMPQATDVLELGCASGDFSRALMDRGFMVIGLELDNESRKQAEAQGVDVRNLNLTSEPAPSDWSGRFGAILTMDVLEHVVDPGALLRTLARLLRKDGQVIVTGPNVAYWAMRWSLFRGNWRYTDAGTLDRDHVRFYTLDTWIELAEESGFDVIKVVSCDAFLPLEHIWIKIPVLGRIVPPIKSVLVAYFPRVFASQFAFQLKPRRSSVGSSE